MEVDDGGVVGHQPVADQDRFGVVFSGKGVCGIGQEVFRLGASLLFGNLVSKLVSPLLQEFDEGSLSRQFPRPKRFEDSADVFQGRFLPGEVGADERLLDGEHFAGQIRGAGPLTPIVVQGRKEVELRFRFAGRKRFSRKELAVGNGRGERAVFLQRLGGRRQGQARAG